MWKIIKKIITNNLIDPKWHWISTDEAINPISCSDYAEQIEELELIEVIAQESEKVSNDNKNENISGRVDHAFNSDNVCAQTGEWFDGLINNNDVAVHGDDAVTNDDKHGMQKSNKMNNQTNSKIPHHAMQYFANQMLLFNKLHHMHEAKMLRKCMLSDCLFITKECRIKILTCLGLCTIDEN